MGDGSATDELSDWVIGAAMRVHTALGQYRADLLVDGNLIVELNAVQAILPEHEVQAIHYLAATGLERALLLNFGARSLQVQKKFRHSRPPEPCQSCLSSC